MHLLTKLVVFKACIGDNANPKQNTLIKVNSFSPNECLDHSLLH